MNTKEYEQAVISYRGGKYNLSPDECAGYISSSGTEGNMRGIYVAKKHYRDVTLFYSADTHYSFDKIADMMSIPAVVVPSQRHGEIDYSALRTALATLIVENAAGTQNNPHYAPRVPVINLTIGTTVK
jgi:histidine decarboxylase